MNEYLLNKTWSKITTARAVNENIRLTSGVRLTDTEFAMLCLIAHHPSITIAKIINHPYFNDLGISTVKRGILRLTKENLIKSTPSENDKRENLITINEVL